MDKMKENRLKLKRVNGFNGKFCKGNIIRFTVIQVGTCRLNKLIQRLEV